MKLFKYPVATMLIALTVNNQTLKAQDKPAHHGDAHIMLAPKDLKWGDAPPGLPKGAKLAVLHGNPAGTGLFAVRLRFPAGYTIPPHWHPTDEFVTVISGGLKMGFGDKFENKELKAIPAGGFSLTPRKNSHYVVADEETIVQVDGEGPFEINYVNPADDPRKK